MGSSALSPELGYQPFRVTELLHIVMNGLKNNVSRVLIRNVYRKIWQAPKNGKITGQGLKGLNFVFNFVRFLRLAKSSEKVQSKHPL